MTRFVRPALREGTINTQRNLKSSTLQCNDGAGFCWYLKTFSVIMKWNSISLMMTLPKETKVNKKQEEGKTDNLRLYQETFSSFLTCWHLRCYSFSKGRMAAPNRVYFRKSSKGSKCHEKWPFFAIILPWIASYGSETSFLLIFSARYDLIKVSWKSDARNRQLWMSCLGFYHSLS